MEKIRVLIAHEARLVRELVRAIVSNHEDFEVAGEIQREPEILSTIEHTPADYLIIEQEKSGQRPAICDCIFQRSPHMKILAVASGSEDSTLYWVSTEIHSARIKTSEQGVLGALRSKTASQVRNALSGGKSHAKRNTDGRVM